MFEKLLKNLPYNPSLVHQLKFYAKRLHSEESIRRTGLVFIVLAFFVQFLAVASPPQVTATNSVNDLINGGITSKSEAVSACRQNVRHYGQIMDYYGIRCSDIADATTMTIKSTDHDKKLYSMGWIPQGDKNNLTGKQTGETRVDIPDINDPLYWRFLWSWDSYSYSTYKALKLKNIEGKTYYILFNCGNLVTIGIPKPYQPPKCQWNKNLLASDKRCHPPVCPQDHSIYVTNPKCKACPYDSNILKSDKRCVQCPNPNHPDVTKSSPKCKPVCPYNDNFDKDSPNCKPCKESDNRRDILACVKIHKTASDTTQGWSDANNRTAQPGDIIVYRLYAKNNGKATVERFVIEENLSDVMDYATVTNLDGGKLDPVTHVAIWKARDIPPGQTIMHRITVQVKDPVPQTPASTSDPNHFDHTMTNVYGNTITIKVPGTTITTIETTASTLPKTGPGTSLMIGAAIFIVAGYFFARARLLATETVLAIQQTATHGGM
jgi:uncharacterized repeat protein (TIGR01451 family)